MKAEDLDKIFNDASVTRSFVLEMLNKLNELEAEIKKEKKRKENTENANTNAVKEKTLEIPFPAVSQDPNYYIQNIAKKIDGNFDVAIVYLYFLHRFCPGALLSVLLQEIARELDLNYNGHISDSKEIYVFSTVDAKIHKMNPKGIKRVAFKYFAAFRTYDDAIFAVKMANSIKNYIMKLWNESED